MAVLYISEFSAMEQINNLTGDFAQIAHQPPIAEQTVSISGSTTQSNAFNAATKIVRLHTDAICSIEIGANPTATTSTARMAANQTEYFGVYGGNKVAVITNT